MLISYLAKFYLSIVDGLYCYPKKASHVSEKCATESATSADQTTEDLSIIIGASWVAPNQTHGLIEVHFPERGKRERG